LVTCWKKRPTLTLWPSVNVSSSSARARQWLVIACGHRVIADRLHEHGLPSGDTGGTQILVLETEQCLCFGAADDRGAVARLGETHAAQQFDPGIRDAAGIERSVVARGTPAGFGGCLYLAQRITLQAVG
jgi:hypothetical protein